MIAVVPVDDGRVCVGGDEAIAEAGGRCVLIGQGAARAAELLAGVATEVTVVEAAAFRPGGWAAALAPVLSDEIVVVLPGSPDGRDLAPRLAHRLGRPLVSAAVRVLPDRIVVGRFDGQVEHDVRVDRPVVAVLQPGVRGVPEGVEPPTIAALELDVAHLHDAETVEVLPADPATMDLAEAGRVIAGGAGLGSSAVLDQLGRVGLELGASLGATRVLTDAGWIPHTRQIGTTGIEIAAKLYVSVGISGAVQHIMGIGDPDHVIAVNTDPSCPMMRRADLAIVTDAPAYVAALASLLGVDADDVGVDVDADEGGTSA